MPRLAVAWIVALAIGEGGCAMIMQQPPKKNRAPREVPICSTGRGGVVLDGLLATALGVGALVAFANDEPGVGLALGAVTGVYGYSAVSGHRSADECEDAMREYQIELAAREVPPLRPAAPAVAATRPEGPPVEAAAVQAPEPPPAEPPVEEPPAEEPPAEQPPAEQPPAAPAAAPAPAARDWSDFWVEVKR